MLSEDSLSQLGEAAQLSTLQPLTLAVASLPKITLSQTLAGQFKNGQKLPGDWQAPAETLFRILDDLGQFLGIGEMCKFGQLLCPKRLLSPK